jgi:uncharacterized protein YprB with RNaseH-like and TPR domain
MTPSPDELRPPSCRRAPSDLDELRRRLRKRREERADQTREIPRRPEPAAAAASGAIVYARTPAAGGASAAREGQVPAGPLVALEDAVPGVETPAPQGGVAYLIRRTASQMDRQWHDLPARFCEGLGRSDSGVRRRMAARCALDEVRVEDLVFVDLETAGLSSAPLFLIGSMAFEHGDLVVRQFLARDYAEERAALSLYLHHVRERHVIVTFNGKSFDVPYLRTRAAAVGLPYAERPVHFDLLHVSRRVWKRRLPDCRLQTLEQFVCGRGARRGDIPGAQIPEAYHRFVHTGDARQIARIVRHNMLDLLTLADLMTRLPAPRE